MRALLIMILGTSMTLLVLPGAAGASEADRPPRAAGASAATVLTLESGPAQSEQGAPVTLRATDAAGNLLGGLQVGVERLTAGVWAPVATVTTDGNGITAFVLPMARNPEDNLLRATYAGDAVNPPSVSAGHRLTLVPRASRLRLTGPRHVVDERSLTLTAQWTTRTGVPVPGQVTLQSKLVRRPGEHVTRKERKRRTWRDEQTQDTGADGSAAFEVTPRATFRWRVVAAPQAWVEGGRSRARTVRNRPPGSPVRLPRGAPRPRIKLPPQRRAVGVGANAVVRPIPDAVWNQMTGRSWHAGCPVGRGGLRLVEVNYWDYDGYRRRGELVVNAGATGSFAGAFTELYDRRLPIRAMYRVDRFGWSGRLNGANDYASMAAGNTSVFNCRSVVNNPGVRSPHSWGRSVDINTWENPYRSRTGIVPNSWWQFHQHPRYAWRSAGHQVVSLMRRHGFRWTYGLGDTQHFDAMGGASDRLVDLLAGDACGGVCE